MDDDLTLLFKPSAVALVGASADPGKMGHIALKNLLSGDFAVHPVNPREREILGRKCYESLNDVPGKVDLAVVVLPAGSSVDVVRDAAKRGVRFVIVTSSGFGERGEGGEELQDALMTAVDGTSTRILGPNTMGLMVPSSRLDTFFIPKDRSSRPGNGSIAIVSQSGAVAVSCLEKAEAAGIGVSACVCLGNKADIDEVDVLRHFADDAETRCIAMYLESFSDGRLFLEVAREISLSKPVVLLKAGRTRAGSAAARSHTGAIASTSDAVVDGALRQAGVMRVYDEEELVDVSKVLSVIGHMKDDRICVVASAGGFGVIASDLAESSDNGMGLRMAEFSEITASELRKAVPEFTAPRNPVDLTAAVTDAMYDRVLGILKADPGVDAIMMSLELQPPNVTDGLIEIAGRRFSEGGPPIVMSVFAKDQSSVMRDMASRGLVVYPTIRRSMRAIAALVERGNHLRRRR
ncbi:MAG: CoA-binding protein [Candidatus Thermoplasmatota archaeon]|nr:CoA-binding protein [Candidatus Thermoplasmatota archaeon]